MSSAIVPGGAQSQYSLDSNRVKPRIANALGGAGDTDDQRGTSPRAETSVPKERAKTGCILLRHELGADINQQNMIIDEAQVEHQSHIDSDTEFPIKDKNQKE